MYYPDSMGLYTLQCGRAKNSKIERIYPENTLKLELYIRYDVILVCIHQGLTTISLNSLIYVRERPHTSSIKIVWS